MSKIQRDDKMKNKTGFSGVFVCCVVTMIVMSGAVSAKSSAVTDASSKIGKIFEGPTTYTVEGGSSKTTNGALAASVSAKTYCYTASKYVYMNNLYGLRAWTYNLRVRWCGDLKKITSKSTTAWSEVYLPLFSTKGEIARTEGGGVGKPYYEVWSKGDFCGGDLYATCLQHVYPWIKIYTRPNGLYTVSWGK